jgi:hypothetical protein
MTDFLSRAGPYGRARSPSFRDSLAALRERLRDGLAEAASRAAAQAVRRLAASLLGGDGGDGTTRHARFGAQPCEYGITGLNQEYDGEPGWGEDPWRGWGGSDEDEQSTHDQGSDEPGAWRRIAAACCQALAWCVRSMSPCGPLGPLASAALAALALLLGGGRFACEAGLALAEAAWSLAEFLTAEPDHET